MPEGSELLPLLAQLRETSLHGRRGLRSVATDVVHHHHAALERPADQTLRNRRRTRPAPVARVDGPCHQRVAKFTGIGTHCLARRTVRWSQAAVIQPADGVGSSQYLSL